MGLAPGAGPMTLDLDELERLERRIALPSGTHDPERFYHCECLDNDASATHDPNRFYHCTCIEDPQPVAEHAARNALPALLAELRALRAVAEAAAREILPCRCEPCWTERDRHDPHGCMWADLADTRDALDAWRRS